MRSVVLIFLISLSGAHAVFAGTKAVFPPRSNPAFQSNGIVLIGLGDSMTQGTMNATNNATNTLQAYMQKVYESLKEVSPVSFSQPLLDSQEKRLMPFTLPTNLGVDGSDIYSFEGKKYYKRYGTDESFVSRDFLCDKLFPCGPADLYDTVLYPINLLAFKPVSQLDASLWLLNTMARTAHPPTAVVILWIGNNDSSKSSLGLGASNPSFIPLPLDLIEHKLNPNLSALLRSREERGLLSFEPYLLSSITRNLTEADDFAEQYNRILTRLETEVTESELQAEFFLCTLPYYTSVGYLVDSEDIEYYLQKADASYTVPFSFKRVAEPDNPPTDSLRGDRISLFTLLSMYILLTEGQSVSFVNQALELNGEQRDGLVLSEDEQHHIIARIDSFNAAIKESVSGSDLSVHLIDTGHFLNEVLTGKTVLTINDRVFNRTWGRGNSFSSDGVHPGYTAHALIANFIVEHLNEQLDLEAPLHDLSPIAENDPYVDKDQDGWVEGPPYEAPGLAKLLLLFKDPDDRDTTVAPAVPPDIWHRVTTIFLEEFIR
jgi:hypothetical protein